MSPNIKASSAFFSFGDGFALAGMICGIVGTVVLVMGILYFLFFILVFGGLALNS